MRISGIAIAALLLCVAAAAADESEKKEPEKKESGSLMAVLAVRENDLWTAFQKKDAAGFRAMLTDEFLMIDSAGITNADQQIMSMGEYDITDFQLSGFRLVQSTPNAAVLAYHGKTHYSYKGQKAEAELNGATVYVKRKGEWAIAFHQDTPVPPPPPEQRKRRRR
jgi:hypothetical protein